MNTIAVNGVSRTRALTATAPVSGVGGRPVPGGAVADLIVRAGIRHQA